MKLWLASRYNVWRLEKPPWFNDKIKKLIPAELLPEETIEQHLAATPKTRKPSAFDTFLLDREEIKKQGSSSRSSGNIAKVIAKKLRRGMSGASQTESKGEGGEIGDFSMGKAMEKVKKEHN